MQNKRVCHAFFPQDLLAQFSFEKMTTYFSQFVKWEMLGGFVLERTPVPS